MMLYCRGGEYGSGGGVAPTNGRAGGLPWHADDDDCDCSIITLHQLFGRCFSFPKISLYIFVGHSVCSELRLETRYRVFIFFLQITGLMKIFQNFFY